MDCQNECVSMREDLDSTNACNTVLYSENERLQRLNDDLEHNIKVYRERIATLNNDIEQHIKWNEAHTKKITELSKENEELKEALRKCSPLIMSGYEEDEMCAFCEGWSVRGVHSDYCKYIKLTKG